MEGNPHAVSTRAYLQDMVDSYLVTVDIMSAGKKCGSVRYPLVLVGNLNGVLKRTSLYQAVEESGPPLLAAFFVRDDGGSVGEPFVTLEDFLGLRRRFRRWGGASQRTDGMPRPPSPTGAWKCPTGLSFGGANHCLTVALTILSTP